MSARAVATQDRQDRLVNLCPEHKTVLRSVEGGTGWACSKCGGRVGRWVVHDRIKGRDVDTGEDEVWLKAQARAAAQPMVVEERFRSAAEVGAPPGTSSRILALALFVDAAQNRLSVRLIYNNRQVPFSIEWAMRPTAGKKDKGRSGGSRSTRPRHRTPTAGPWPRRWPKAGSA